MTEANFQSGWEDLVTREKWVTDDEAYWQWLEAKEITLASEQDYFDWAHPFAGQVAVTDCIMLPEDTQEYPPYEQASRS
jgi:hypothetical protein